MAETNHFSHTANFPCSVQQLYDFHSRPGALERLIPPWEKTEVIRRAGGLDPGGRVEMRMHAGPFPFRWVAHHVENNPGKMFRDIQAHGPFSSWSHSHFFSAENDMARLEDAIEYRLPFHRLMPTAIHTHVEDTLKKTFSYRERVLRDDLLLHNKCSRKPLRILISGSSGVLGRALIPLLTTGGHQIWRLVRRPPDRNNDELYWNPQKGIIDDLPALDAVIHLAGEYIGLGRWTNEKKRAVIESRTLGTTLLASTIARQTAPPKVFLSASAVGYYGDTGEEIVDEYNPAGADFISDVCSRWEGAAEPATQAGIRTVTMRIGISLTTRGGALQRLLATKPIGFFKKFGTGNQYISWISIDDTISAMLHALWCSELHGPLNIAAPNPVTNSQFLAVLARITGRPQMFSIPESILHLAYGQMASEILLSGCRVSCQKLLSSGFQFRHNTLEEALAHLLGITLDNTH